MKQARSKRVSFAITRCSLEDLQPFQSRGKSDQFALKVDRMLLAQYRIILRCIRVDQSLLYNGYLVTILCGSTTFASLEIEESTGFCLAVLTAVGTTPLNKL
jgi:hypothetical protein